MGKIKINGKTYPARMTIGAMIAYKRDMGEDFTQFKGDDMEKLGCIVYHAIRTACKADGLAFPFDKPEDLLDCIELEQAAEVLGFKAAEENGADGAKNWLILYSLYISSTGHFIGENRFLCMNRFC